MRTDNPATAQALALPRIERAPSHFKALPYQQVADCIDAVRASGAGLVTKLALEFLILTACRSGEVREVRWEEIDLSEDDAGQSATWTVPASRMKMKKTLRVPLSPRAVEILEQARQLSDSTGLVFPGATAERPLSDMTLSKLIKHLGFVASVHGFRTSFSTWAQEQTNFPREICEAALAHQVVSDVERRYARSDVFHKRSKMMHAWAQYLGMNAGKIIKLETGS